MIVDSSEESVVGSGSRVMRYTFGTHYALQSSRVSLNTLSYVRRAAPLPNTAQEGGSTALESGVRYERISISISVLARPRLKARVLPPPLVILQYLIYELVYRRYCSVPEGKVARCLFFLT